MPAAIAPAPPAAPPAAPTPPTPPAPPAPKPGDSPPTPPAPPSPPAVPKMPAGWTDPMAEIDALGGDEPPAPPSPPKPADTPPTPPAPPAPGTTAPPAPPNDDLPGAPPAPERFETKPPGKTKELREAYERQSTELTTLKTQLAEAQAKMKDVGEQNTTELLDRIKALETERDGMAKDLAFTSYERSPDYRKTFVEPITSAFQNAYADIEDGMTVTDPQSGEERPATAEDFNALVRMPVKEATKRAQEQFGPVAQTMLTHRAEIVRLDRKRVAALDDYKKNSAQYEKDRQTKQATYSQQQKATWETANREIADKYPTYFKPDENDPKGNELLQNGLKMFDAAVSPASPLAPEQRTRLLAAVRHKAASFDRMAVKLNAANKKISELEAALAEFDESTPGGEVKTPAGGPPAPAKPKTWQEELAEIAE